MSSVTAFMYLVGSIVCHQIPERSFYAAGIQFPVCARCTGLYLGGVAGLLLWLAVRGRAVGGRTAVMAVGAAALPTLLTVIAATVGWWDPTNAVRAAFAAPLGVAGGVVVAAGLSRDLR